MPENTLYYTVKAMFIAESERHFDMVLEAPKHLKPLLGSFFMEYCGNYDYGFEVFCLDANSVAPKRIRISFINGNMTLDEAIVFLEGIFSQLDRSTITLTDNSEFE